MKRMEQCYQTPIPGRDSRSPMWPTAYRHKFKWDSQIALTKRPTPKLIRPTLNPRKIIFSVHSFVLDPYWSIFHHMMKPQIKSSSLSFQKNELKLLMISLAIHFPSNLSHSMCGSHWSLGAGFRSVGHPGTSLQLLSFESHLFPNQNRHHHIHFSFLPPINKHWQPE